MLETFRNYILLGDVDTVVVIELVEQLRLYLLAEESNKQAMMEQYYRSLANYEEQLDQIRKRMEN